MAELHTRLARGETAMLVHVAQIQGSAPREAGARMRVGKSDIFATIGGGELEYRAIDHARRLLAEGAAGWVDWSLGPELGQCCGGRVVLAFEPFAPADAEFVKKLVESERSGANLIRKLNIGSGVAFDRSPAMAATGAPAASARRRGEVLDLTLAVGDARPPLWLFGAGHVGRAVVDALALLDFAITWIDGRAGQFPDPPPAGIRCQELAMPELIVDEAPDGTSFLVMTHSHPLDEEICAAVLADGRFAYLGLIGSATKRTLFERRLAARGLTPDAIARIHCPIGLPGIHDKRPAAIAASVAADLLIRSGTTVDAAGRQRKEEIHAMNDRDREGFMRRAIELSAERMRAGQGGPFGAVIVRHGEIVAEGWNNVTTANDPTAHAEVSAIRTACARLGTFSLEGCEIFTSCEPCPMCLAAIYWARIDRIWFANTRADAAAIGFDDDHIYGEVAKPVDDRAIPTARLHLPEAEAVFAEWREKPDKVMY